MRKEREQNFREARDAFSFLESMHDMQCVYDGHVEDAWQLRYESKVMFVVVGEMPPGYEFDMRFGRRIADEEPGDSPFTIADLLALAPCAGWDWSKETSTVSAYANILRKCGVEILGNNQELIVEMKSHRDERAKAWHAEEAANYIRREAQAFWENKDYTKYVDIMNTLKGELTSVEKKRLAFAQKKVPTLD